MKHAWVWILGAGLLLEAQDLRASITWQQQSKAQFQTGTLLGLQATWPPGEDDGLLRLATPVYNGSFDETDDSLAGWTNTSAGAGPHRVEVLAQAGGRNQVLHLYAEGLGDTARVYQDITEGLDQLERFNFWVYPVGSEISPSSHRLLFLAEIYDTLGQWIATVHHLLSGDWSEWGIDYDYRDQLTVDQWNLFRLDLKNHIQRKIYPYTWQGVGRVRVYFLLQSLYSLNRYGVWIDDVWAALFPDDNFDDGSIDQTRWTVYDSLLSIEETNGYLRFYGYERSTTTFPYASLDRTGHMVGTASAEAAARVHLLYMEPKEDQEFELGFYSPSTGRYAILRAHRLSNGGVFYIAYSDGSQWYTTTPVDLEWPNRERSWRILYDDQNQCFSAWVDGYLVGCVDNFSINDFYPYLGATSSDLDPSDSLEVHVDGFQYLDFAQGDWTTRYLASGAYQTAPQDLGVYADFLRLRWVSDLPTGTACRLQIRTAATETALTTAPWEGPEGPGTYYEASPALVPRFHDGHRWFQVRVLLSSTDSTLSPSLDTLEILADTMEALEADSSTVVLTPDVASVVQYDDNGQRSLVATFFRPQGAGNLVFTAAVHPEPHPGMLDGLTRWWNLQGEGTYDSVHLTFFYQQNDLPDPNFTEADLWAWRWDGVQWTPFPADTVDTLRNWLYCSGVIRLSQWTLGPQGATEREERGRETPTAHARLLLASRGATLELQNLQPGRWHGRILDAAGRQVAEVSWFLPAGFHRLALPAPPHAGVYFLRLESPKGHGQTLRWVALDH